MPSFTYKAVDKTGRESSGRLSADSRAAAIDQVAALGLQPVSLNETGADHGADVHPMHARRISRPPCRRSRASWPTCWPAACP